MVNPIQVISGLLMLGIVITFVLFEMNLIVDKTDYTEENINWIRGGFGGIAVGLLIIVFAGLSVISAFGLIPIFIGIYIIFTIPKIGEQNTGILPTLGLIKDIVTGDLNKTCQEAYPITSESQSVFGDPRNKGECWTCPPGFKRTASGVTDTNACVRNTKANFINTVASGRPVEDPIKEGTTCPSGYKRHGLTNVCWKCPDGYNRNYVQTDTSKMCEKCTKKGFLGICTEFARTGWNTVFAGTDKCKPGYVPKLDVFGNVVKCIKPPDSINIENGVTLTKIGDLPVSDPANWKPDLLNNNLRLSPGALKKLENEGWKLDAKTPDLFFTCNTGSDTSPFLQKDSLKVKDGEFVDEGIKSEFKFKYARTINPDLNANTACEKLSTAIKLGSVADAEKIIAGYREQVNSGNSVNSGNTTDSTTEGFGVNLENVDHSKIIEFNKKVKGKHYHLFS